VPEPKVAKNRVHLDLQIAADTADGDATAVEAEVARLVVAGATVLHRGEQGPFRWVTMTDPEGNEFCLKA
jgi:predicted enzyme related to lactoylglutathione lyase